MTTSTTAAGRSDRTSRRIGPWLVGAVGLGAAGFSVGDPPGHDQAVATISAALDAGVSLIDTAACYTPSHQLPGHNERIIAAALRGREGEAVVATKAGIRRIAVGGTLATDFEGNARPEAIREQCEISLRSLGVETIDLFQLHAPDPEVPLAETIGTFEELQHEGRIRAIGLCNVDVDQLEEARTTADIVSVQNRFSPGHSANRDVIAACERYGIAFLAYSPLGGLGQRARDLPEQHPAFRDVAAARGISPQRVTLAWELTVSPVLVPIPGARRPETIADSAGAADLVLTPEELRDLAASA